MPNVDEVRDMGSQSTDSEPASRTDPPAEPTLAEAMSAIARRIPFNVAMGVCAAGIVLLSLVLVLAPSHWRVSLAFATVACFGAWTMSDHERRDAAGTLARRWRLLQSLSAVIGVASVFALLLTFLASALGLWIS